MVFLIYKLLEEKAIEYPYLEQLLSEEKPWQMELYRAINRNDIFLTEFGIAVYFEESFNTPVVFEIPYNYFK